ncbi:MAG TPA: 50S ribosomal protein L24 [Candidatus Limnocylindria bacterium]
MKMKIRKGDEVVVLAGKDRGKRGKVQEVRPQDGFVVVAGVNIGKRHTKANPSRNEKGGIIERPMPLGLGKVMLVCPHCGRPARIGHRLEGETKERYCRNCDRAIGTEGGE